MLPVGSGGYNPAPMRRLLLLWTGLLLTAAQLPPGLASADPWYRGSATRVVSEPVYRTQRDGSRYAASNCGPAALGMVLDAYGVDFSTLDLRRLTHTYQGT